MSNRTLGAVGFLALAIYGITYWSLQPTCGPGEVRVRGMFMTECVARQWRMAR
ncbi:hypothetical protein JRF84_08205 [Methylobacterium organophilum]|uniref:hypothetical protein n=1 Tax=Methylobacterium TaxID=407 RepID=UPI0019D273F8|nr:hypothetical protein [Methylobacterium organophilum]MBN6819571.1 hypothetical protein [Methylobacterium organophilum]